MITQERLRELFDYDTVTGQLIWKENRRGRYKLKGEPAGTLSNNGYMQTSVDCRRYRNHRLVWMWHYGQFPENDLDHINNDRADNRIENLRKATRSENMQNQKRASVRNKIGYPGVSTHKHGVDKKYFARIQINGKQISCGYHETPELAHAAYLAKKREVHPFQTIA